MLTGEIRSQIDAIWNAFWSGGISNPLEVMEQITYLLFLRRLDEMHTLEENKAQRLNQPMARRIYPEGNDAKGRDYQDLRWSRFNLKKSLELSLIIYLSCIPWGWSWYYQKNPLTQMVSKKSVSKSVKLPLWLPIRSMEKSILSGIHRHKSPPGAIAIFYPVSKDRALIRTLG